MASPTFSYIEDDELNVNNGPTFSYIEDEDLIHSGDKDIASGEWTSLDNLSGALAFLEGATLGWSDEIGIGVGALAIAATSEDETTEEVYSRLKKDYNEMQKSFAERHPVRAAGLEIAGSIVSPVSKIGAAAKGVSTVTGLTKRAVGEGLIYGAGKAEDLEDIPEEAFYSGLTAGGTSLGLQGIGFLFKRRIEAPLETEEGLFKPITLAANPEEPAESFLHSMYRDVVGVAFGAKGVIRGQEEKVVRPLTEKQAERAAQFKDFLAKSKIEEKESAKILNNQIKNIDSKIKTTGKTEEKLSEEAKKIIEGNYKEFLGPKGAIIAKQTANINKAIDVNEDAFRLKAFTDSLPSEIPQIKIENILKSDNPNVGMLRLENAWKEHGFQSTKNRKFRINPKEIESQIKTKIAKEPALAILADSKAEIPKRIKEAVSLLEDNKLKGGWIQGEELTALRSSIGTVASSLSDEGGQSVLLKTIYREMQGVIDNNMKSQLSGKALKSFEADRAAWRTHSVLKDAVTAASVKVGLQGKFTPDQWLSAIRKNSPLQSRQGTGPLANEAQTVASLNKKAEKTIVNASNNLANKLTARRTRELERESNKAKAKIAEIDKKLTADKTNIQNDPLAMEKIAANSRQKDKLQQELAKNKEHLDTIKRLRTPQSPGWFHQMASTGFLGSLMGVTGYALGGGIGSVISAAGAVGLAKGLSEPSVQRAIAGQTKPQTLIQNLANTPAGSAITNQLTTGLPRAAASGELDDLLLQPRNGMLTGQ